MWREAGKTRQPWFRVLAIAAALTGIGSAFFHASGTRGAAVADYLGMFLGTGALTALNLRRWLRPRWAIVYSTFLGISFGFLGAAVAAPAIARWLYVFGSPCCAIELRLAFRDRGATSYRDYWIAWILVGVAAVFWWMDESRVWCDPSNHLLGGHALWHLLSAAAFPFIFWFYRQFDLSRQGSHG